MKNVKVILALVLCVCTLFALASCGDSPKQSKNAIDMTVVKKSVDDAKKAVEDKGCTPVVIKVYDEKNKDGDVLSVGEFLKDAKKGDYVVIGVNDLSLKKAIEDQPLAPRIIEKSSYEKIYNKLDESTQSKFDTYYTLKTTKEVSEKEAATTKNAFPVTAEDMEIYVLDTSVEAKELKSIEKMIKDACDYSYDDMFNDYVTVGIIPTPSSLLSAEVLTKDNAEVEENTDGTVTLTMYTGNAQTVVVPAELDGKTVSEIAKGAIPQSTLHTLVTEDGLTKISDHACPNAYGLMNLYLSSTVNEIGVGAFSAAQYTNEMDGFVTLNGNILVAYTGSETDVKIPEGINFVGTDAFNGNTQIKSVEIPEGVQSVGENAFRLSSLEEVKFPSTLLKICDGAFYQNRNLKAIEIPENVVAIGNEAFRECTKVASLTLGKSVKTIGDDAFLYNNMPTLDIPASVETLGNEAFYKCQALTTVTGATGVKNVGSFAFNETPFFNSLAGDYGFVNGNVLIKYSLKEAEASTPANTVFLSTAFKTNAKLKSITVNDGCTEIGKGAFTELSKLKDVTIPASVTTIDPEAFDKAMASTVTIHCTKGSAAEAYAKENHFQNIDAK